MYCRTATLIHNGDTDEIINNLREQKDKYDAVEGLHSVTYVKISDKEFLGFAIYESKAHLEAAAEHIQGIMKSFMPLISTPPVFKEGDVPWIYSK
jgi:hypothetical protein